MEAYKHSVRSARRRRRALAALFLAIALSLVLLVHLYRPEGGGMWFSTLYNVLHAPVFGVVSVSLLVLCRLLTPWSPFRCLLTALAASFLLATISEIAQIPTERDASVLDLATDWLGSTGFLLIAFTVDRKANLSIPGRVGVTLAAIFACYLAALPLINMSAAYIERHAQLPLLFDPAAKNAHRFVITQDSSASRTMYPFDRRSAYKIRLQNGRWPGIIFHDLWPDWSEYSVLVIEIGIDEPQPLTINLRVHDLMHLNGAQDREDRFNASYELASGAHTLRIPLDEIRTAPDERQINLQKMAGLVIFCQATDAGRDFYLASIRLE
jgi:hypothetical protein